MNVRLHIRIGIVFAAVLMALPLVICATTPLTADAATDDTITVDVGAKAIYANGTNIVIQAGSAQGRTLLFSSGHSGSGGDAVELAGVDGNTQDGYDLSGYSIYGGTLAENGAESFSSTSVQMEGGLVGTILGGGNGTSGISTYVSVTGGSVTNVFAAGREGKTGESHLDVSGGSVGAAYLGGIDEAVTKGTVSISGGTVGKAFAGGSGSCKVSYRSEVDVSGGTVTTGIYGIEADTQSVWNATIAVTGSPDLSQAVISSHDQSGAPYTLTVRFSSAGTSEDPLKLASIDLSNSSRKKVELDQAQVSLTDKDAITSAGTLCVPDGSSLGLEAPGAVARAGLFEGGGSLVVASGAHVETDSSKADLTTHVRVASDARSGDVVFECPDALKGSVVADKEGDVVYKATDGTFRLGFLSIDASSHTIDASGEALVVREGSTKGRTILSIGSADNSPLALDGIEGSETEGYDLSGYTIYGGTHDRSSDASSISMIGGTVKKIRGGCSSIAFSGGSAEAIQTGARPATVSGGYVMEIDLGDLRDPDNSPDVSEVSLSGTAIVAEVEAQADASSHEVSFSDWGSSTGARACPTLDGVDVAHVTETADLLVEAGTFTDLGCLDLSAGRVKVAGTGVTVGDLSGGNADGYGSLELASRDSAPKVTGTVRGVIGIEPAPDAVQGDVVARGDAISIDNFVVSGSVFDVAKNGSDLALVDGSVDRLVSIEDADAPGKVTNGATEASIVSTLPSSVSVVTSHHDVTTATVTSWWLEGSGYDPTSVDGQTVVATGVVGLPSGVSNPGDLDLRTTATVTVPAADVVDVPSDQTWQPQGISDGSTLEADSQADVSADAQTSQGMSYIPVRWEADGSEGSFDEAGGTYHANIATADMTAGAHVLALTYRELASDGSATGNVVVTQTGFVVARPQSKPVMYASSTEEVVGVSIAAALVALAALGLRLRRRPR